MFHDDFFGHRHPLTGDPIRGKDEWTDWDYRLIESFQVIEDWTNEHGLLRHEVDDEHDRVIVEAHKKIDKFEAAKQNATSGEKYKPTPGEYFVPHLILRDGADWPTREEYIKAEIAKAEEREREEAALMEDPFYYQKM